jgi:hypothetical protein
MLGARRALVAALLVAGLCAGGAREAGGEPAAPQNSLNAVSCTLDQPCFAVGEIAAGGDVQPLIETLHGQQWRTDQVAPIAGSSLLSGVSCVAGGFCVAVGSQPKQGALTEVLLAGGWTHETVLSPPGAASLTAVSCVSEGFCVAVGSTPLEQPLVETWSGSGWTQSDSRSFATNGGDGLLTGVSCVSVDNCVAVGTSFLAGKQTAIVAIDTDGVWQRLPLRGLSGAPTLTGVSCVQPGWCLAVGSHRSATADVTEPLALRIEADRVTRLALPAAPTASFNGVSCPRIHRCVAVGDVPAPGQPVGATAQAPFAEALNGGAWAVLTPVTQGTSDALSGGVSCLRARRCVAVGYDVRATSAQITAAAQRLAGAAWKPLATPRRPG